MASQSFSIGAYASAVIKNGSNSKISKSDTKLRSEELVPKSIIKAGSQYYQYFGTVREYIELNEIRPGDLYSDGIYAVEYKPENDNFFRVMAVYYHKETEKYYYLPSSFSYLSTLDPNNKSYMPITVISGPIEISTLSKSEYKKICEFIN
jgi:hypothetical protein